MNPELTPEQQAQLNNWVGQRDSILKEIANARVEEEKLNTSNKNLSQSNTEIANKIQQGIGRLEEIDRREAERKTLVSAEVAGLETKKTGLETTVTSLESDVKSLGERKSELLRDVANITGFHDHVFEKVNSMEGIVSKVVGISSENATKITQILESAGVALQKVVDVADRNVEKTNKVILDIPQMLVDIHKGVMEKRTIIKVRPK